MVSRFQAAEALTYHSVGVNKSWGVVSVLSKSHSVVLVVTGDAFKSSALHCERCSDELYGNFAYTQSRDA